MRGGGIQLMQKKLVSRILSVKLKWKKHFLEMTTSWSFTRFFPKVKLTLELPQVLQTAVWRTLPWYISVLVYISQDLQTSWPNMKGIRLWKTVEMPPTKHLLKFSTNSQHIDKKERGELAVISIFITSHFVCDWFYPQQIPMSCGKEWEFPALPENLSLLTILSSEERD